MRIVRVLCFFVVIFPWPSSLFRLSHQSIALKRVLKQHTNHDFEIQKQHSPFNYDINKIRNFCIIAHVDHGKSTLADRLLEYTGTVARKDMQAQLMDTMDIERERGITIKLNTARLEYLAEDGEVYLLNLIDTPGHVDFQYEVSRSLAACEGALLVVDASQGVEAQTLANTYLALEHNLTLIPVLNKIDLPHADPDRAANEIETSLGLDCSEAIECSAKTGKGVRQILEAIVKQIPPPSVPAVFASNSSLASVPVVPLRALIYDSIYESYRGVLCSFRVMEGSVKKGDKILFMQSNKHYEVTEVGITLPLPRTVHELRSGEVGYLSANIKSVHDARVGDTITLLKYPALEPLPGYAKAVPMVFCGMFPVDADQYELLRESLDRLKLNDASLSYSHETSSAMGFGFRVGFLGLLHLDIVQERLEREYNIDLVITAPSVVYEVVNKKGQVLLIDNPAKMPDKGDRVEIREPFVRLELLTPTEFVGGLMELAQERRGEYLELRYISEHRSVLVYNIPLSEIITNFFDEMKSKSKGFASMEYTPLEYKVSDLVRIDVRVNGEQALPLTSLCHRDQSQRIGRVLVDKLKELIPRHLFKVPIQACIGEKVIASSVISAMRKDVTAKCYGGDVSRKKKLLMKQAAGKKRMKAIGKVDVPQEAFMAIVNLKSAKET